MSALLPLVEIDDIEAISGETYSVAETDQIQRFIGIAQAKLRNKVPRLDERVDSQELSKELVVGTAAFAVIRALDTFRTGIRVRRQQYPEVSTDYEAAASPSLVYFTDDEIDELIDRTDVASSDAFTIRIG
ncbi:hypothetical protein [Rhodococcus xishaensis]|uniref:Uncharacterized protein n=1 Tax=Rhodococcus xishaensis TaxID=2487364 RepID=A0A3S3BJS8_9NOCA|nr:hypothetical protein [Rhodococcus xishaensis]RVW03014.1 hypothetical protein EGT50_09905 [Rhodococcus xishaensis]